MSVDNKILPRDASIKVSVIMPIYNAYDYLRVAIDGVLGQTLTDIELICVDDGSTDRSLDILKEYKEKDSYELTEFMNDHIITVGGVVVTEADKQRICDMATGLFWTRITEQGLK